jgi:nicotinamidase-related amidase
MIRSLFILGALCAAILSTPGAVTSATIVDQWTTITAPTPPPLKDVTVESGTTALLVLDWIKQFCTKPSCLTAVPNVAKLVQGARAKHAFIIYSLGGPATRTDILPQVAPVADEPTVKSGPDKYIDTDLEQILKSKGIKTVIVTGYAAEGAALYTASHASLLGLKVIVPIDAIASDYPYAMQYVTWNLVNAPRVAPNVTLTTADRVAF